MHGRPQQTFCCRSSLPARRKGENIGYISDKRKQLVLQHGDGSRTDAVELLDIKRGKWPLDRVKLLANELYAEFKAARDGSTLAEGREKVEQILNRLLRGRVHAG